MKYYIFLIMLVFIACKATQSINNATVVTEDEDCIKQGVYYSMSDYEYTFLKEEYKKLLDSLLVEPVTNYFCSTNIQGLRTVKAKKTRDFFTGKKIDYWESHSLAPLFINLENFDGIYSYRVYQAGMPSIRYFGGNFHDLFLLADDTYYRLTNDSTENARLIEENLTNSFDVREICMMQQFYPSSSIKDYAISMPAYFIRRDDEVLFDAFPEEFCAK